MVSAVTRICHTLNMASFEKLHRFFLRGMWDDIVSVRRSFLDGRILAITILPNQRHRSLARSMCREVCYLE